MSSSFSIASLSSSKLNHKIDVATFRIDSSCNLTPFYVENNMNLDLKNLTLISNQFDKLTPFEHYDLRRTIKYEDIEGQLTKAGSLSVENRLLHYIIAYILVQRNTNHAQPTVNDLRFMYAVKNNVMINWPEEILKIMNSVSLSQSKLLPYSIFISRIVDYLRIDVSDTIIVEYTDKDHLVGESLIHKMGIYKYGSTWQYQEDYTTFGLDLSDDDNQDGTDNQHATAQGEPSGSAPQNSAFGFDQLEAMEQRLNNRMDLHFQGLKDSYFAGMEQYEERQTAYSDNQFRELRSLIQSTAEAQNALFCSEFQKLSMLIRGDQNIVTSADHPDDPHPPPQP
ncbi:hypothetical protein Lal_00042207 [Lupinus albus]|nr:hypothetical protein Lal_00042207 [Lupinus albus]